MIYNHEKKSRKMAKKILAKNKKVRQITKTGMKTEDITVHLYRNKDYEYYVLNLVS